MGLGCPLLLGLSARRLRRCAATAAECNEENIVTFSPDLVDEKIKASLSALTELMDRFIRSNSARETSMVSSRESRHQYEKP